MQIKTFFLFKNIHVHVYRISLAKQHYFKLRNIDSLFKVFEECLTKYDEFAFLC